MFNRRLHATRSFAYQNLMAFKYAHTTQDQYLYLMVGRKYGNAVQRNQLKRWVRILYHETIKKHPGLGLMVRPIKTQLTFREAKLCFQKLQEKVI